MVCLLPGLPVRPKYGIPDPIKHAFTNKPPPFVNLSVKNPVAFYLLVAVALLFI